MHSKLETVIQNAAGLQLSVSNRDIPTVRIDLPDHGDEQAIRVIFPEHVTARKRGSTASEHLYVRWEAHRNPALWRQGEQCWEYERRLNGVHILARATLEIDGVRFRYEFSNESGTSYDMIYAVTDPRLTSIFHDVRLERTYVHHADGFDLLASETPERLTMPLNQWLPLRYSASFSWPVPLHRMEQKDGGVIQYNKSRPIDEPLIATVSADRSWVVASFARDTGNVWTNPEHTCQHADPQISLLSGQRRAMEMKVLVFRGSLDQTLQKVKEQRNVLE